MRTTVVLSIVLLIVGAGQSLNIARAMQPSRLDSEEGVQILTRGPIHEAFAETVTFDPEPGIVVTEAPPEPIEELAPDQKPEGASFDWIPGYWAWDDERSDFLWVSGVWRALPPGREWVPGYWGRGTRGYQWTAGYWADSQENEIEYLPEPPESVEGGPNIARPSEDDIWIPGSWVWQDARYAWRPGYWLTAQRDWDWVPAHYVWTPRGYLFVDGFWDYSVARRGVLFAPVYFERSKYARRDFTYSPSTIIDLAVFGDHLFIRPRYDHYYFGDYYAPSYRNSGFYASFSFSSSRLGYDPIYSQQRWQHRRDPEWARQVEENFRNRRDHEDARPRHTLIAQLNYFRDESRREHRGFSLARSFEEYANGRENQLRFRPVDSEERRLAIQRGKEVRQFRDERQRAENDSPGMSVQERSSRSEPLRVKSRRSPLVARPADQFGRGDAPPRRPESPRPNPKVKARLKKTKEKKHEQ